MSQFDSCDSDSQCSSLEDFLQNPDESDSDGEEQPRVVKTGKSHVSGKQKQQETQNKRKTGGEQAPSEKKEEGSSNRKRPKPASSASQPTVDDTPKQTIPPPKNITQTKPKQITPAPTTTASEDTPAIVPHTEPVHDHTIFPKQGSIITIEGKRYTVLSDAEGPVVLDSTSRFAIRCKTQRGPEVNVIASLVGGKVSFIPEAPTTKARPKKPQSSGETQATDGTLVEDTSDMVRTPALSFANVVDFLHKHKVVSITLRQ